MIKRILHIIPSTALGGTSSFIMNVYRNINRNKIQFDFIAFNRGELHDEIINMGGRIFYFDLIKKQGLISYIKKLKKIIINEGPFYAVHAHQSYKSGFSLIAAKSVGIEKRIAHTHAISPENKWHKLFLPFFKQITVKYSTKLLACSQIAGESIYGKNDFLVVPNNIDMERFLNTSKIDGLEIRTKLNISKDTLLIGHVGRFSEVKNHRFIIKIAEELKNEINDFKILLVGDGPLKNEINEEIISKKLNHHFIILSPQKEINKIMKSFDIFLFPSLFESFSIVLLEAQASGIVSVVSNTIPKYVDLNLDTIKYKDLNELPSQWACAITKFREQPNIKKEDIKNKIVEKGFNNESIINKLLEIYNS